MRSRPDCSNSFETKVMIFDFDGVIIDSMGVKIDEYSNLFSQFTKDESTLNKIVGIYKNSIGVPRETTFKKVFIEIFNKSISNREIRQLSQQYSQAIFRRLADFKPLNGFLEYLTIHKKINKYIISGAPHSDITCLVDKFKLLKHFKSVKGGPLVKKDEIIDVKILEKVKGEEIIYFGDQKNDYIAAKAAEIRFVGINAECELKKMQCSFFSDFHELINYEITRDLCIPKE